LIKTFRNGNCDESVSNMFGKLEREDFLERIRLFEEENQILLENHQQLSLKFTEVKAQKESKEIEAETLLKKYSEINDKYKTCLISSEEIKRERDVLENKLNNIVETHMYLDVEKSDLISKLNRSENEIKVLRSQLESLKKTYQDFEEKKKLELNSLKKENESIKLKDRDNVNKVKINFFFFLHLIKKLKRSSILNEKLIIIKRKTVDCAKKMIKKKKIMNFF